MSSSASAESGAGTDSEGLSSSSSTSSSSVAQSQDASSDASSRSSSPSQGGVECTRSSSPLESTSSASSDSEETEDEEGLKAPDPSSLLAAKPLSVVLETTEQHLERHAYPAHVRDCARCRYVHNRARWEEDATFLQNGLARVWLVEQPQPLKKPWHLGCCVCMQAKMGGNFGRCRGGAKLSNIIRHGNSAGHRAALKKSELENTTLQEERQIEEDGLTFAHVLFQRTLIAKGGSFSAFQDFCHTARLAGASFGFGSIGPRISRQLTQIFAERETSITSSFLRIADVSGLMQDALSTHVVCRIRMVCWKWPRKVEKHDSVLPCGVLPLGSHGPWLVDRIAAVGHLGSRPIFRCKAAVATRSRCQELF